MNEALSLDGCTPQPLMGYLKALGVLRLVSEQKDAEACGFWKEGAFKLFTILNRDQLIAFFRDEYRPSPIVAPWAGGSGFFGSDNKIAVDSIANSSSPRLRDFAELIRAVHDILSRREITVKPADATKEELLREYRRILPDRFIDWMDAVLVVQASGQSFPPLLGTGGNDGRLDFTQNFMQRLVALGFAADNLIPEADQLLRHALFATSTANLYSAAVGQFDPGRAGGPNATTGFEGRAMVNPWDFVLMLEGALLLSGAVSRRMGTAQRDRAAFPFTVNAMSAGYGSGSDAEEADSRGEIWLPIWETPATARELHLVFAEGRAEYNGRQSKDGLDFARSVASLGVDRGFTHFIRYGFLKRSGKAFVASPLGTFPVREKRAVDLLREIDVWLERFRWQCGDKDVPNRYRIIRRLVEERIIDLCRFASSNDSTHWLLSVLAALGAAERALSIGGFAQKSVAGTTRPRVPPLAGLSSAWLQAVDDGSTEFNLARAIATLYSGTNGVVAVRTYLEAVEYNPRFRSWSWRERSGQVVWSGQDLARNLAAVACRRLLSSEKSSQPFPVFDGRFPAALSDIGAFLACHTDDGKLDDLVWGLSLLDLEQEYGQPSSSDVAELPRAYSIIKLTLLPGSLNWERAMDGRIVLKLKRPRLSKESSGIVVKPETAIFARLRAGDVQGACEIAVRRLKASGFSPIGALRADGSRREIDWTSGGVAPERLLAAQLFPIADFAVDHLAELVLRRPAAHSFN